MENTEKKTPLPADTEAENELILKLRKPYTFEDQTYTELDLSALENVTAGTLERVGKTVAQQSPGINPGLVEMSMPYCIELAARVMSLPREFFHSLPAADAIKLKSLITNFLYSGDGEGLNPADIRKCCMALAITLHDGMGYYLNMPLDELNETAGMLVSYLEEVARRGKK